MTRLERLSPDLADRLRHASPPKQRAAALAACEFAVAHTKVEYAIVEKALKKVRAAGVLAPTERAELDALAAQLDEEYFVLQDAAEEGRASTEDYMRRFSEARAIAALSFVGGEDAFQAATEAIYEAAATTDDNEALTSIIQSALQ